MTVENLVTQTIDAVLGGQKAFCKFLSANDTGETGAHQSGIYIAKPAISILFDTPGVRGQNKDRIVKVRWQDGSETDTRFIYYGQKTRNEYRITRFDRGFSFLRPEYTGALFILVKESDDDYAGFFLNTEEEIDQFLTAFNISATETNNLINISGATLEVREQNAIDHVITELTDFFPLSEQMSAYARQIYYSIHSIRNPAVRNPDKELIAWTDEEYRLFRAIEHHRYFDTIHHGFDSVEDFVSYANGVLNRRKSRAGKSLEHHLGYIFDEAGLLYTSQAVTEGNKRPDFLFPSREAYHDVNFPTERLATLAAKTTCKDRWRQVINEANRLREFPRYLCTLQQGISGAQMDEMQAENVILVVPKPYIKAYPVDRQNRILTVRQFVEMMIDRQSNV